MAKKKPWDIVGDAVGGAGSSASNAGGGGGRGGGAVGSASGGVASVSGGVGTATGTSTGYSSVGAGVSSVASGVGTATGTKPSAPTPVAAPYTSRSTTTVNLKPLIGTISDPATRALASSAISNGLKYEVNLSVLLAAASVTDYGRKGHGKGYTNLGDGSEDGPKSIRQAAKYLSEAGFHSDPDGAIKALAKTIGHDPSEIRKTASGYTELDQAARTIEETPGDMRVKGVGRFKYRKPEDRPGVRAMQGATGTVPKRGVTVNGGPDQALNQIERNAMQQGVKNAPGAKAQAAATAAQATADVAAALTGQPTGPNPRRVARRLTRAAGRATPEVTGLSDPNQATFAAELSKETGLSPRVVAAWVKQEGGNLNPGDNNWLNIGAFDSGFDQGIMGDPRFRDPVSAAKVTADFLRGKEFGASEGIQGILSAAGSSDEQQIQTIANSGWAGDPNYAANISRNYQGVSADPGKDVPKQLVQRATDVLGREATKALLAGGKLVKAPKGGVKEVKFDGRYAGSQDMVRAIVGTRVKGDHGGTKNGEAPGVHTANGDHYRADGYAQDINGTSPGENEPPYNQQTLDSMVANLRKMGADVPDLTIGENWEGTVGKYSVQLLTNEGGTVNHIHIGAHPTDGDGGGSAPAPLIPIKGTNLAVRPPAPASSGSGGSTSYGGTSGAGSPAEALGTALNEAAKQQRQSAGAMTSGSTIQSAAAAYARKSLQGGDEGDPLYDAFRPSR